MKSTRQIPSACEPAFDKNVSGKVRSLWACGRTKASVSPRRRLDGDPTLLACTVRDATPDGRIGRPGPSLPDVRWDYELAWCVRFRHAGHAPQETNEPLHECMNRSHLAARKSKGAGRGDWLGSQQRRGASRGWRRHHCECLIRQQEMQARRRQIRSKKG